MLLHRRLSPFVVHETPGGAPPSAPPAAPPPPAEPAQPPAQPVQQQQTTPPAAPAQPPAEQAVPYTRFQEVNTQRQTAEQERDRLQTELTRREREGMPELDRARAELADAQRTLQTVTAERDTAVTQARNLERGGWVRRAATAANFHDPEDAVLRTDLATIDSEAAATRHVQTLAASDTLKHLIRPATQPTGGDLLQQILKPTAGNSQTGQQEQPVVPADQFNAMTADQLVALQERDPQLYDRSLRAAAL